MVAYTPGELVDAVEADGGDPGALPVIAVVGLWRSRWWWVDLGTFGAGCGTNRSATTAPFGLPTAWDVRKTVKQGSRFVKYDLRDGFFAVPVEPRSRNKLIPRIWAHPTHSTVVGGLSTTHSSSYASSAAL